MNFTYERLLFQEGCVPLQVIPLQASIIDQLKTHFYEKTYPKS